MYLVFMVIFIVGPLVCCIFGQRSDLKINKKSIDASLNICIGQPQVCTRRGRDLEAFEKAVLKEFGSNKEVTLTWGEEIKFTFTGNFKPLVEKYQKVDLKKAISEAKTKEREEGLKAMKNAVEKIIGDITLEAKGNVDIDDSDIEFSLNGKSNEILNQLFSDQTRQEPEYAFKICTEKKCLHEGQCTKNLCNHPEDLVKMANSAEGINHPETCFS
jgi:hypothetical protein